MLPERQPLTALFQELMVTVVGQAYQAAGYQLQALPLQQLGGKFRWHKPLDAGLHAFIDYQVLVYTETAHAPRTPSRFRVTLTRSDRHDTRPSAHPRAATRTLSALVVQDFGVAILPSPDHWWTFHDMHTLGKALAEAGHLVVGYGMGWLEETLVPPTNH